MNVTQKRTLNPRSEALKAALKNRILVLDGAMGTAIQDLNLTAKDFGGADYEGCNEYLVITRPELIQKIHENYFEAGADIVETNTFGATPFVLDEYKLGSLAVQINTTAVKLARAAAEKLSTPEKPRFVAGSIGPTTKAISVTGGITFEELAHNFYIQAKALTEAGADYLLIETCQDTRNIKAALVGIDRFFLESPSHEIPIAVSGTIEPMGTMLAGQSVEALYASLAHRELLYIGVNCATGPEFMTDSIRSLAGLSKFPVSCVPNAGLPDENGCYLENPEMVSQVLERFIEKGWVNVLGGCCGTHAGHIHALSKLAARHKPRTPETVTRSFLSGIDYLEITDEMRPVIVGERTNSIGSRKFKRLIAEGKFEEAAEIARAQVKNGAQIIDVCLANPDRNELEDIENFLKVATKLVRAPFMIDSTDDKVMARALTYSQGKAILNSINLEDGEERFEKVIPLAKTFGAALVVGTIDEDPEQGMGVTRQRKLEIALRSYKILTEKYRISPQDIYWDPLVFPCATGDAQYIGSALETIEGIRLIKQALPETRTILGVSNVSFGLPEVGREILNSVFLYHCVKAGLDLAIVNAEKLVRYAQISDDEKKLSEDLLFNRGADPIAAFAAHFREKKVVDPAASKKSDLPLDQRLAGYIVDGTKVGLIPDLDEALKSIKPLDIINGPLMAGMDQVGKLFNTNQLIVAEVLQSAEVMKAAVSHLEKFMTKTDSSNRGTMLLATVKGDVHDIGKNLVEIILSNNGFKIINLGIKVLPETLIQAAREQKPDLIGLSGLLVKSAQQMVITADDLAKAGIHVPILVGGAALSQNFVDRQISKAYPEGTVAYAKDAMDGLELAKTIMDPEKFTALITSLAKRRKELDAKGVQDLGIATPAETQTRSPAIEILKQLPHAPDLKRHLIRNTPIQQIWKFINPLMLYTRHLGIKGGIAKKLNELEKNPKLRKELELEDPKALQIYDLIEEVKKENLNTSLFSARAVYQFFSATGEGNSIEILRPSLGPVRFTFPRQKKSEGLCLSDYVSPQNDEIAFFVVSCGDGIRETAEQLKSKGEYLKSHIIQALAIESAEAYAELLHSQIRKLWGYADPVDLTLMERFQAKYQGKRYSFGYPACPRLDDQAGLFSLLKPEEIGVQLTDGFMMDPEASVSAVVFHHPQATYFSVGNTTDLDQRLG